MIDRSLRVRTDLCPDSRAYNMLLTTMLRRDLGGTVWANWTLDPTLEPGMVGVLDPLTGAFELLKDGAVELEATIVELGMPGSWVYQSAGVGHVDEHFEFDGDYRDPSSEQEVDVGLREAWTFAEAHTIVSRGTRHSRRLIDDPVRMARRKFEILHAWAKERRHATDAGIRQGFGVVTATYQARGAINLASREAAQSFAIDGSFDGVACMAGEGDPTLAARASYRQSTGRAEGVEAHLHPADPGCAGPGTAPYAFEFMSFAGRTAIPGWLGPIPAMSITFRNTGSYVVTAKVTYDTDEVRGVQKQAQVSGGIPGWVHLPVDACHVCVACRFWHVDGWGPWEVLPQVANPLQRWPQGQGEVDISGSWPGEYQVGWAQ